MKYTVALVLILGLMLVGTIIGNAMPDKITIKSFAASEESMMINGAIVQLSTAEGSFIFNIKDVLMIRGSGTGYVVKFKHNDPSIFIQDIKTYNKLLELFREYNQ